MVTSKELAGMRFGKLTALEMVGVNNDRRPLYKCHCDCGATVTLTSRQLMEGKATSCGCDKRNNLIGKQFSRWTVVGKAEKRGRYYYWHCVCSCGNEKDVRERSLLEGTSRSCGCLQRESAAVVGSGKKIDLTGMRFGRLTVIRGSEIKPHHYHEAFWHCKCDCGAETDVLGYHLRAGLTSSCGCLKREISSSVNKTHGESGTRLFRIWNGMKSRCKNKSLVGYKNYGGRGIYVCEEWDEDYITFRDWALSHGYNETLSIDRIDNDGPYSPENCRWATRTQQCNNRRSNIFITYNGETHTATEWGRKIGVNSSILVRRKHMGWSDVDCIETPVMTNKLQKE